MSAVRRILSLWLTRAYVPLATCLLVVGGGHWLVQWNRHFDAAIAAQDARLTFQNTSIASSDLTRAESYAAQNVLELDRMNVDGHKQLYFVGNSQTLAIMDRKPGDLTSPQYLQVLLSRQGRPGPAIDVRLGSLPNLTITEMLIKLVSARQEPVSQADVFLAGLVLQQFRSVGVRPEVTRLAQAGGTAAALTELLLQNPDLPLAAKALAPGLGPGREQRSIYNSDRLASSRWQKEVTALAGMLPLIARRENILAQLKLAFHEARNHIFGIHSDSARPVEAATYLASLELIELAFRFAERKNVQMVFYIAPIRPLRPNPYLPENIERLRHDLAAVCQAHASPCFDYSALIPENLWTNYPALDIAAGGQADFAHFTGEAHRLLATQLVHDLGGEIWASEVENRSRLKTVFRSCQ